MGPTWHVLDWFHLAMRIQNVAQAPKGWPDASAADRPAGVALADTIERIRWRLWHGQVKRALDLINETAGMLEASAEAASSTATSACKVARLLRELETYVSGHSALITDDATARRCEEPISTAVTESTVQWLLHPRMNARQQMRGSPRGAHLMLKVRTATINGTLERDHVAAERWARRPFRHAASVDAPFRARENIRTVVARGRMLPSVRPFVRQRPAAGLYGSSRTWSKSQSRTRGTVVQPGSPDPVSPTVAPYLPSVRPTPSRFWRAYAAGTGAL